MDFLINVLYFLVGLAFGLAVSYFRTEAIYKLYINLLHGDKREWWQRGDNPPWESDDE